MRKKADLRRSRHDYAQRVAAIGDFFVTTKVWEKTQANLFSMGFTGKQRK